MLANLKELPGRISDHNVTVASAGIAFYGLLALVPTLIALVSTYSIVTDPAEIESQVADLAGSLDAETQAFVRNLLEDIVGDTEDPGRSIGAWLSLIAGIALALFSASGAVQKMINTISVAYDATESRPGWKQRLMAYGFTAAAIVGVTLMALVVGAVPAILDRVSLSGGAEVGVTIVQFPVLGLLFGLALTVLYRYSPDRDPRTPWLNPGAITGTLLFIFFAIAFSFYSANIGVLPASYGLLGSIAALMIFLQLTALSVIIGAEVNGAAESAAVPSAAQAAVSARRSVVGRLSSPAGERADQKTLSFGKALAGLIALFVLGRGAGD